TKYPLFGWSSPRSNKKNPFRSKLRRTFNRFRSRTSTLFRSKIPLQFQSTISVRPLQFQALRPSSEAPSRNPLPEALSPYFRVSTVVAPYLLTFILFSSLKSRVYGQGGEVKDPGALAKRDMIEKKLEEDPNSNTIELIETVFGKQTHGSVAVLGGGVKPKDFKEKSEKKYEIVARLRQIEEEKSTLEKEMDEVKNAARIEAEQQKRRLDEMENQIVNMQSEMQAQMQAFMESQMLESK
ncbi:hypothetical protein LINPERHAP2_LOCUS9033, partial [Linum perenne]